MFTNIKANEKEITFDSVETTRSMKKDDAVASTVFIINGFVATDKAIKCAIDKAIISFRDSNVKAAKSAEMSNEDWMSKFNSKTITIDIDKLLSADGREADPIRKVAKEIKKSNVDVMVAAMMKKGIDEKTARAAIAAFIS